MARWRAEALERLPELRATITSADRIMALWIGLYLEFERAYKKQPPDESLIARIYSFADWCLQAPRNADAAHDPLTATIVAFYEHIPTFKPARDDMPRWFKYSDVAENRATFSYFIGEPDYLSLLEYMFKNKDRYEDRQAARVSKLGPR